MMGELAKGAGIIKVATSMLKGIKAEGPKLIANLQEQLGKARKVFVCCHKWVDPHLIAYDTRFTAFDVGIHTALKCFEVETVRAAKDIHALRRGDVTAPTVQEARLDPTVAWCTRVSKPPRVRSALWARTRARC
jgi:hypothetical protein